MKLITRETLRGFHLVLYALLGLVPLLAVGQDDVKGKWENLTAQWPNIPIHVHVLPSGKILFWGRREWNADATAPVEGLNPHNCTPRIWDPATGSFSTVPQPGFNLFCAGHCFMADGRLLVAGGHYVDGKGVNRAAIYDPATNTWTQLPEMKGGRWYPTAITLADGGILVSGGTDIDGGINRYQEVFKDGAWKQTQEFGGQLYYPRLHLVPDGRVLLAGPDRYTQRLDVAGKLWTEVGNRKNDAAALKEAPSVMFESGKIIFIGGGDPPQNTVELLDLTEATPGWKNIAAMSKKRRHHNATLLPDGTVLVTGGSSGAGFNNRAEPVKLPELWSPVTKLWTSMAEESAPRLYHATAVLLPDARVLSAGGGEYAPDDGNLNLNADCRRDVAIFSPPYLFKSGAQNPRPMITNAPAAVSYGQSFTVQVAAGASIGSVNWIRLGSVTHAFNANQIINYLEVTSNGTTLTVKAPPTPEVCPPGHYMLFVLDQGKVPSVARIIRIN